MPHKEDLLIASDGIRTRASFFRRTYLPGTPYISSFNHTLTPASEHLPTDVISSYLLRTPYYKASQEWVCAQRNHPLHRRHIENRSLQFHVINSKVATGE